MQYVRELIDKAAKICGSDQALADRLGIARPNVSLMRKGTRAISPATAAELADIAGEDAQQAVIDAVVESVKGTRREALLREILGKAQAAGGAAMCHISYSEGSISAMDSIATSATTIKNRIHRIYQGLRRFLQPAPLLAMP